MPSPVVDRVRRLAAISIGIVSLCAACAPVDVAGAQTPPPQGVPEDYFANWVAEGSFGHRLVLLTKPGVFDRASAILTFEDKVWRVSDEDCPAFRDAIAAYQRLPVLRMGPALLVPEDFRTDRLWGRLADYEVWTLTTDLRGPEGAAMEINVKWVNGPYALWITETVGVIKSCGPPRQADASTTAG